MRILIINPNTTASMTAKIKEAAISVSNNETEIIEITRGNVKLEDQDAEKKIISVNKNGQSLNLGVIKLPAFYMDFEAYNRGIYDYKSSSKDVKRGNSNILKNPEINLEVGQEYIDYLLDLEVVSNNLIFLAAAYNGGPGNLKKWLNETNFINDPLLFMESIPSRETRWFIEKILTNYWIYKDQFEEDSQSLLELSNGNDPIYYLKMNNTN